MTLPFGVRLVGLETNQALVRFLSGRYSHGRKFWAEHTSCSPAELGPNPRLGTEPRLVEWLWTRVHASVPEAIRWVVVRTPVLVHPDSEIVFAFAASASYAFRFPLKIREMAVAAGANRTMSIAGSMVDLSSLEEEWVLGLGEDDSEEWWQSAFRFAGEVKSG